MSLYQRQFNYNVLRLLPARSWQNIFLRMADIQWDRTCQALLELDLSTRGVLDFNVVDLSLHWSIDLEKGCHTLAIFSEKAPGVPIIVVERKLPCIGSPDQERTLESIRHHWSGYSEETILNNALAETVNHLKDIAVDIYRRDIAHMESANGYHIAHNVNMKEYL